jgi:hypothetical protein
LPFNGELGRVFSPISTLLLLAKLSPFLSLNLSCNRLVPDAPLEKVWFRGRFTEELLLLELGVIFVWLEVLDSGRGGRGRDLLDIWLVSSMARVARGSRSSVHNFV